MELQNTVIDSVITTEEARNMGISKHDLHKLVDQKVLERVARGMYAPGDIWIDDLYVLHKRCPKAVFSHDEAFYHHELIDREPLEHSLTIYTGFNPHRLKESANVKVYTVKKELLELGKEIIVDNFGNSIPMYDLERTVCDAIRSRNSIEIQDFKTILQSYVRRSDKNLNKLMEYAKLFKIDKVARNYFEVLL